MEIRNAISLRISYNNKLLKMMKINLKNKYKKFTIGLKNYKILISKGNYFKN